MENRYWSQSIADERLNFGMSGEKDLGMSTFMQFPVYFSGK